MHTTARDHRIEFYLITSIIKQHYFGNLLVNNESIIQEMMKLLWNGSRLSKKPFIGSGHTNRWLCRSLARTMPTPNTNVRVQSIDKRD